jgi:hypothetical protein
LRAYAKRMRDRSKDAHFSAEELLNESGRWAEAAVKKEQATMSGWTIERVIVLILLIFAVFFAIFLGLELIEEIDDDNDGDGLRSAAVEQGWDA